MIPIRRRAIAVLVCAGSLGLAGCATGAPSLAAEVGGARITEKQTTVAYEGIKQAFGEQANVSKQAVLDALIRGAISDQIAAQRHLTITDAQRDAKLSGDASGAKLLTVPAAKVVAYDLADEQILAEQLGTQTYTAALAAAKVTVNPRYGNWATVQGQTGLIAQPGSLSSPASPRPAN